MNGDCRRLRNMASCSKMEAFLLDFSIMQSLSRLRFNALAGYSRHPNAVFENHEVAWFKSTGERLLGTLVRHFEDGDFGGVLMARDRLNRYRCVDIVPYFRTEKEARALLRKAMEKHADRPDSDFHQGDEKGEPMDFFTPVVADERLHKHFKILQEHRYTPALGILNAMMHYFQDPDGNFVEQFQTSAFDARLWELYLFCALTEELCAFDRDKHQAPDFLCNRYTGKFFVEAVTVNPTVDPQGKSAETGPPLDPTKHQLYLTEYIPIKYGSSLFSKLKKKYWELPHVKGFPVILAIQDFHYPGSMIWSEGQLASYLYGLKHEANYDKNGTLTIKATPIKEHTWGSKVIPSGFFNQPDSEHISAVITNSQATINKFNRLGIKAGFGDRSIKGVRTVSAFNPDPNASQSDVYLFDVHDHRYQESWVEGMNVYHNPKALIPLPNDFLAEAIHHRLKGDQISSYGPEWRVLSSITQYGVTVKELKKALKRAAQAEGS